MGKISVSFVLNGQGRSIAVDSDRRLIDILRDDFGLTGTKQGCDRLGECWSCAVLIHGKVALSCLTTASSIEGKEVLTIEGLGSRDSLHPLQRAFIDAGAVQCGFCTPGMIMTAKALLDSNPHPTREEVTRRLSKNLCRCTGYAKIIEAVMMAAGASQGESAKRDGAGSGVVGRSVARVEEAQKVLGEAKYGADLAIEGMLIAKVLRGPFHHARILSIDKSEASKSPGVAAVITASDIPGQNGTGIAAKDQPILARDEVKFLGEPVAAVAADDEATALEALKKIRVEYEPLPSVHSPAEALSEGAPKIAEKGNLLYVQKIIKGDVRKGFKEADVVVENEYSTPFNEHAYLETEAGIAYLDEDGRVVLRACTQFSHFHQGEIARVLGIEPDRVRVIPAEMGGAFGSKVEMSVHAIIALLAQRLSRPVKMVYSREESFLTTTKRHPMRIKSAIGAKKDGLITAMRIEITSDTGAYISTGVGVIKRACIFASGPYSCENILIEGRAVHTNNTVSGAMRGYGVPQVAFAIESQMDILASKLGIDPLDLRYLNALRPGSKTATGQELGQGAGLRQTIDAIRPYYKNALARREKANSIQLRSDTKRGVGVSCMWMGIGVTGFRNPAHVDVELLPSGRLKVYTAAKEMGQGSKTVMAQIVAQELGVELEAIEIISGDTLQTVASGVTSGSRTTYFSGNAAKRAATELKKTLLQEASAMLGCEPELLAIVSGTVFCSVDPYRKLALGELAAYCSKKGASLRKRGAFDPDVSFDAATGQGSPLPAYGWGANLAEVEVNLRDGSVKVVRVVAAHDVGRAINPLIVEGQIEGGVMMGLGFALKEEFVPGLTRRFSDYPIPKIGEMPEIVPLLVEVPEPSGPFSAKGIGEGSSIGSGAAIINAIADATGARVFNLPASPSKVLKAITPLSG